jgi:hypothetical protein
MAGAYFGEAVLFFGDHSKFLENFPDFCATRHLSQKSKDLGREIALFFEVDSKLLDFEAGCAKS